MATGDIEDIKRRIKADLPPWFGSGDTPILDALIAGLATVWADAYGLYEYVAMHARIRTSTGGYLDIISADFFGTSLPRNSDESDSAFRTRILAALFREKATRAAIYRTLLDLTGRGPRIVEHMRPADTGGYGIGGVGYGVGGGWGSVVVGPYQAFVTAYRPAGSGIPLVSGYGVPAGAYSTPSRAAYASIDDMQQNVADAQIYKAIDEAKPAGTIVWTQISN
jgi:hypothetical protein